MTKFQNTLQYYYEKYDDGNGSIAGLIGILEARKVITKEEAEYLMELLHRHAKDIIYGYNY